MTTGLGSQQGSPRCTTSWLQCNTALDAPCTTRMQKAMTETLADYCAVGESYVLQSFTDHFCDRNSLPLYVSIRKKGTHLKNSQRLVYVHERKKIPFALCVSEKDQLTYSIPVGKESVLRLIPTARPSNPACILPSELLACKKSPPRILRISKSFVTSAKGTSAGTVSLKEGTLLFPQEIKNKKKATVSLSALTENGLEVTIDLKSTGCFSVSFHTEQHFDLVNILKTFKEMIKLPMEVSICKRGTAETVGVAALEEIRERWALCGMMTGEIGEERGKIQFLHKAELPPSLAYTAQKMVPRDSHSKTTVQLKTDYEKAVNGHGIDCTYDVPNLTIYETVEVALASNPAYDLCGGGAASVIDGSTGPPPSHLPPAKYEEAHRPLSTCAGFDSHVTSHSKPALKLPLSGSPALNIINTISGKCPQVSQVRREVDTRSAPRHLSHTRRPMQMPVADALSKAYPGPLEQHSEADVQGCDTVSADRNVTFLKSLDVRTIQRLLSGMNLSEHRDRFQEEHVDGEILASCDVECLQDLGVTRRIQQLRLTKLIDGTHSASKYLNK